MKNDKKELLEKIGETIGEIKSKWEDLIREAAITGSPEKLNLFLKEYSEKLSKLSDEDFSEYAIQELAEKSYLL